jgi:hypothetical protein
VFSKKNREQQGDDRSEAEKSIPNNTSGHNTKQGKQGSHSPTENVNVRNIGQGESRHRKYKRLKLGGGQAYDRSND